MRACGRFWGVLTLSSILVLNAAAGQAAGQASRRGFSSRGVNPVGSRTSLRGPTITGAVRPAHNSGYGANSRGPLSFNHVPNVGGFHLDLSAPHYFPGDYSSPSELGAQGEAASQGDGSSTGSRPNVRPRLNIADRDAMNASGLLKNIRQTVYDQIAACAENPFTPEWDAAHENTPPVNVAGGNRWRRSEWAETSQLVGINADPYRYDFRPDDRGLIFVYRNRARRERAVDVRGRAVELAKSAESLEDETPAVSMGVFAAIPPVDKPVRFLLHIAINKSGAVSGSQYDFTTDSMKPLQGALDPASQRVAWQVGNDFSEAGLKNLTEAVARSLLFREDGWTQSWILMRIPEA